MIKKYVNKPNDYTLLINALKEELERWNCLYGKDIRWLMVEYIVGEFCCYLVVGIDNNRQLKFISCPIKGQ